MCRPSNHVLTNCCCGSSATIPSTGLYVSSTATKSPNPSSFRAGLTVSRSTTACRQNTPIRGRLITLSRSRRHQS